MGENRRLEIAVREPLKIPFVVNDAFTPAPYAKALFRRDYVTTPGPTTSLRNSKGTGIGQRPLSAQDCLFLFFPFSHWKKFRFCSCYFLA